MSPGLTCAICLRSGKSMITYGACELCEKRIREQGWVTPAAVKHATQKQVRQFLVWQGSAVEKALIEAGLLDAPLGPRET